MSHSIHSIRISPVRGCRMELVSMKFNTSVVVEDFKWMIEKYSSEGGQICMFHSIIQLSIK